MKKILIYSLLLSLCFFAAPISANAGEIVGVEASISLPSYQDTEAANRKLRDLLNTCNSLVREINKTEDVNEKQKKYDELKTAINEYNKTKEVMEKAGLSVDPNIEKDYREMESAYRDLGKQIEDDIAAQNMNRGGNGNSNGNGNGNDNGDGNSNNNTSSGELPSPAGGLCRWYKF